MNRNTLIAQITLGSLICFATTQMSQAMQEPPKEFTLVSADGRMFPLSGKVAFVSGYIRTLKTGGFAETFEEKDTIKIDIPGKELHALRIIMQILYEHRADPKEVQIAAITRVPQISAQNIGTLIDGAEFLQLPENCITGLIYFLAEHIRSESFFSQGTEIPFTDRKLLVQLGRTYFLKYDQDLALTDVDGNAIDIGGFSVSELLSAGRKFRISRDPLLGGAFLCDLSDRKINSLEGLLDIPGIDRCRKIVLNNNQITTIQPSIFQDLKRLHFLSLQNNQITGIQPGTFQGLANLQVLDMSNNQITTISPNTFEELQGLTFLFLHQNKISSIEPGVFRGLSNLISLSLTSNQISSISPEMFEGIQNLGTLFIANNIISAVEAGTFRRLTNLEALFMAENNLRPWVIEQIRQEIPPTCGFSAENQRGETPEERRQRLVEAAGRRRAAPAA